MTICGPIVATNKMAKKRRTHDQLIELIITIGSLIIAAGCMAWLGYLVLNVGSEIPEYTVAALTSVTTLIMGYLFGKRKNGNQ